MSQHSVARVPQIGVSLKRSARARGREGGRPLALTRAKVRLAQAAMGKRETNVRELCVELGVTKATLYRYVGPNGELRQRGQKVLGNA